MNLLQLICVAMLVACVVTFICEGLLQGIAAVGGVTVALVTVVRRHK